MITVGGVEYEPWSNGPLFGTIWASSADGVWVVIKLAARGKEDEIVDYTPPEMGLDLPPQAYLRAEDVMTRYWRCMVRGDSYLSSVHGRPEDRELEAPTDAQVAAAREVLRQRDLHTEAERAYRQGHQATNAVGDAKLLEMLRQTITKEDDQSCATETTSSEE